MRRGPGGGAGPSSSLALCEGAAPRAQPVQTAGGAPVCTIVFFVCRVIFPCLCPPILSMAAGALANHWTLAESAEEARSKM